MAQSRRSIFEEVQSDRPRQAAPAVGVIDRGRQGAPRAIRFWLIALFALVVVMIQVGGLTRLTDSGLAITEWRPVMGALPPLSEAAWQSEFDKYKQIPEYRLQNRQMSLAEFKTIYWWEWGHRQLGRVIGLVWAVGFAAFAFTRRIPPGWTWRLALLGGLGALQGAIGWWMVVSGLGGEATDVASYRLAVHLGLAFTILGVIAWFVFLLGRTETALIQARRGAEPKLFSMSTGLMHLVLLQILVGALVAGIDAGRTYTDWPLMNGQLFPPAPFELSPVWRNLFENPGLVQFLHRLLAYALAAFAVVVWLRGRRSAYPQTRATMHVVLGLVALQVLWGIYTVRSAAPWEVAILHQLGAIILWVAVLRARFLARYPVAAALRRPA